MSEPTLKLYLIRHGTTDSNQAGRLQGHLNVTLSARGEAEAEATGQYMATQVTGPATLISSTLLRASQTAQVLSRHLKIEAVGDPSWMEMDVGNLQGKTWKEAEVTWPDVIARWYTDPRSVLFPGARESIGDFAGRVGRAMDALVKRQGTVIVVTHGGALNVAMTHLLKIGLPDAFPFHFTNCGVTLVNLVGPRLRVQRFNHTCHLAPATSLFSVG